MMRQVRRLAVVWGVVVLSVLALGAGAWAAGDGSIVDQGWSKQQEKGGESILKTQASVVNDGTSMQRYEVKFLLQSTDKGTLTKINKSGTGGPKSEWALVYTVTSDPFSLAAGASTLITDQMPYDKMGDMQKAYRVEAELLLLPSRRVVAWVFLNPAASAWGGVTGVGVDALAAAGGAAVIAGHGLGAGGGAFSSGFGLGAAGGVVPPFPSGHGTMSGTNTSERVGGQWVEDGSGTMTLQCTGGLMSLNYTYHASGPDANDLTATLKTASGTYSRDGHSWPVVVSEATVHMVNAGARTQSGTTVTRTNGSATGTFSGTIGGKTYSGILTLTDGTQTLNLTTGQGTHNFDIRFTTSKG